MNLIDKTLDTMRRLQESHTTKGPIREFILTTPKSQLKPGMTQATAKSEFDAQVKQYAPQTTKEKLAKIWDFAVKNALPKNDWSAVLWIANYQLGFGEGMTEAIDPALVKWIETERKKIDKAAGSPGFGDDAWTYGIQQTTKKTKRDPDTFTKADWETVAYHANFMVTRSR